MGTGDTGMGTLGKQDHGGPGQLWGGDTGQGQGTRVSQRGDAGTTRAVDHTGTVSPLASRVPDPSQCPCPLPAGPCPCSTSVRPLGMGTSGQLCPPTARPVSLHHVPSTSRSCGPLMSPLRCPLSPPCPNPAPSAPVPMSPSPQALLDVPTLMSPTLDVHLVSCPHPVSPP